jgi:hypothetical protein
MNLPFEAEPIRPGHSARLQGIFASALKSAWCYYAPFLCCFSLPPAREVFVAEHDGALWLPVRRVARNGRVWFDLVIPPIPLSVEPLVAVLSEMRAVNRGRCPRILWLDEADRRRLPPDRLEVRIKSSEYLYDPSKVVAAVGRPYRDLRKKLRRFREEADPHFREMTPGDVPACQALLRYWRKRQGRKRDFLLDWGYTRSALSMYGHWRSKEAQGFCVEVEGRIAAFAIAGRMHAGLANFFIAKTNPDVRGLSEYLRTEVYRALVDYDLVNDAGDLGLPGLRQHKQKFRPVARIPVYSASFSD